MTISTSIHSKAFNFMSFLLGSVDPRTGQYTVAITLPDVKTNDLRGPGMPLSLTYNPFNTQDSGFGRGWNLRLSQYTPGDQILSLSSGETYKVTSKSGMQLMMQEKKLDSFRFYEIDSTRYRVEHKSGLVEILEVHGSSQNRVALPVEIYAPEGHKVTLDYEPFSGTHQILKSIKDDADQFLLTVTRASASVEVLLYPFADPSGGPLARFVMTLEGSDRYVSKITLPTENQASWRFGYTYKDDQLCISSVETPTGGREEVFYQDLGHQFPASAGRKPLPRVTRHVTHPGAGQPEVDVHYTYPQGNFLGYGSSAPPWTDDGLDNLYKNVNGYVYRTVEALWVANKEVRTIERTFNQFHLLTLETTTHKHDVETVQATETTYYLTPGASFEQQPNYCQLPKEVKTSWSLPNTSRYRSETVSNTYDSHGNLLTQIHANGVTETSTWHPAADASDFVRRIKDSTVTPAPSNDGKAPTLRISYTYKALPPMPGRNLPNWYAPESETQVQVENSTVTELQRTVYTYTNEPGNAFLHGRVSQQKVTINQKTTTTDYVYSKHDSPELKESVLRTVETVTGFDHGQNGTHTQKVITTEQSVLIGEPLLALDNTGVRIRYYYDVLRRVIRERVAPDTQFEASRRYEYLLCAHTGDQAEQSMFDVKNVKTCSKLDGLNRVVEEERDDADNPTRASVPRQIYKATYDPWGNLSQETEKDWLNDDERVLTSVFEYDDWGNQRCVTGPDGVKTFEETDPIGTVDSKGPIQRSWRVGKGGGTTGVTETWFNLFEKPVRTERFDLDEKSISLHQYFYDGLGRTAKEIIGFGTVQRVTIYEYDVYDRMIKSIQPDGAEVERSYAPHSTEDLPVSISVNRYELGSQKFDGLNRLIETDTGGRKQVLTYAPGETQPKTTTTPSGEVIEYGYQPQLNSEPVKRSLPRLGALGEFDVADYTYDQQNARLLFCQEQGLELTREYFSTGELKSEMRVVENKEYTMDYQYSRLGRLLRYTDVLRHEQSYDYDDAGQLIKTELGTTLSTFTYDAFGRTHTINTTDSGSGQSVGTTLEYDDFEREAQRNFNLNGVGQILTQEYNDVDGLKRRTLKEGARVLRDEVYEYDLRGRLTNYVCTGTEPPVDPYGKAITRQVFYFDAMDNIRIVMTYFPGGSNRAVYSYDNTDKTQLSSVTNTHADYPAKIELDYDSKGNLIQDEVGRTLEYDALSRLITVSDASGGGSRFKYDGLDTLTGKDNGSEKEQLHYNDGDVTTRTSDEGSSSFMLGDGSVLAEHQGGGTPKP